MEVKMEDFLARVLAVVDYQTIAPVSQALFFRDKTGHVQQMADERLVFLFNCVDAGDLFLRDDQNVRRRLGLMSLKARHRSSS